MHAIHLFVKHAFLGIANLKKNDIATLRLHLEVFSDRNLTLYAILFVTVLLEYFA